MLSPFLSRFVPDLLAISTRERVRSACGALVGILLTGLIARSAVGSDAALPALIAPMGASAVLLFAVPSSPLAQPWSILGGNLVAALVGVTAAASITDPVLAASVAVGLAIALMMLLGCLHPPSGAVALTAVLGGPAIRDLGYGFVLWPVGLNSALLLVSALVFNNLTGRSYPHVAPGRPARGNDPIPASGSGLTAADLDAALRDVDEILDIGRGDLQAILRRAQIHASLRRSGQTTCAALLSRNVRAIAPETPLRDALEMLRGHRVTILPVTDEGARVLGVVTQSDLIDKTVWDMRGPRLGLGRRLRLTRDRGRAPHGSVADVMTTDITTLHPDTVAGEAALLMTQAGLHHAPVTSPDGRLVGVVAQTDLVGAMLADMASRGDEGPSLRLASAGAS
ncbi:Inosine-5'-monophosphate dehydrogenase [Methylobacterium thuringiense]|uniref:Inosine-5'-monophosphate dehydrogenase n=1 Tax=Methylobacterium thuringiense TaxID=1003091 RepID=A0ABQ4THE7_9HYPH|nr:Inosine-5'-monophosphate dehydrogenase [Methylobacterium thuringiense]